MQRIDLVQGSDEWHLARIGSIGGSSIASAVAKGEGKSRKNLLYRLAGEILTGVKYEGYTNQDMQRGLEQEPSARDLYEFMTGNDVEQTGLIRLSEYTHFSPDGLVGKDGIIEIKSVIPSVHIETFLANKWPAAYRKQCQWGLHICDREWCDFISYSPLVVDRPIIIIRGGRNEKLIKELHEGANKFVAEMLSIVKKVRG